jgi:hypothetical protein
MNFDVLGDVIHTVLPDVVAEFNMIRLPSIEQGWGRTFAEEFQDEDQITVEIAKQFARPLNNCFFRQIHTHLIAFTEHTSNGFDYMYGDVPIEDKNSFSNGNYWVGNGFVKTPIHIFKKFHCTETGRIDKAFVALVNLNKCKSGWTDKTMKTNRSVISFGKEDAEFIHVIYGDVKLNRKKIKPILEEI